MTMARPAYKIDASNPGSDISMETAAAFAAGYMAFKDKGRIIIRLSTPPHPPHPLDRISPLETVKQQSQIK